jgi:sulfatase modifying factor 1
MKPSDLDAMPSDEYELDAPAAGPTPPVTPVPLPRMWKTEDSDPEVEAKPEKPARSKAPGSSPSRGKSSPGPSRKSPSGDGSSRPAKKAPQAPSYSDKYEDPEKKKVLVEETPEWDTYETRRRARLVLGLAIGAVVLLVGWISYRMVVHDPNADESGEVAGEFKAGGPVAAPDLDLEARAMIDRAREFDETGRRKESVALLEKLIKVYPKVPSARLASDALKRAGNNEPMFPDGPETPVEMPPPPGIAANGQAPTFTLSDPARGLATMPRPGDVNAMKLQDPGRGIAMNTPGQAPPPDQDQVVAIPGLSSDPNRPQAPRIAEPARPLARVLPKGFHPRTEDGVDESGWPRVIINDLDGEPLSFIPEGTFIMGGNGGPLAEEPAHRVRLRPYYIDQHEVTIGQFEKFLDKTGYRSMLPRNWTPSDPKTKASASTPVALVNYKDAEAYADWSRQQLPTEAQWEKAARSEKSNLYPWGSEPITWSKPRGFRQIDPVMSFPQDVTRRGVFDLAGNVSEWTSDWYDSTYFQKLTDDPATDPTGPARGPRSLLRTVKGGSKSWRVSHREGIFQEKRHGFLGFRCVLNIESTPAAAPPGIQPTSPNNPNLTPVPF